MKIEATHKVTREPLVFESTTASAETLDSVLDPSRLELQQKRAYFDRRRQLDVEAKKAVVMKHCDRLNFILVDIWERAPGPADDDVHRQIKATSLRLDTVLKKHMDYAKENSKNFKEVSLIQDIRAELLVLKGSIPDVDATREHIAGLERARQQVGDVLARAEAGIRAWVQGASIAYRGSLATGWRNANKSRNDTAQRINLLTFDSDAFVTIPHNTWAAWNRLEIVLNNKLQDKMSLSDLIARANSAQASNEVLRVRNQLEGIRVVEEKLQDAMKSVKGYKLKQGGAADFEFVLQTRKKTEREMTSGNLYPLNQIAKAGLPLTEQDLDVVVEDGVIKVRMPERHVSMSETIGQPTYPTDPVSAPHTHLRPTERMVIDAYFNAQNRVPLNPVVPVERSLIPHVRHHADLLTFNWS